MRSVLTGALGHGTFDWVTEVATALPAYAISELLGVPTEDRPQVTTWTNTISGANDPEFALSAEAPLEAATALYTYATKLAEQRRAEPHDDIVTKLITEVDDDALGAHEFEIFVLALAVAGNETDAHGDVPRDACLPRQSRSDATAPVEPRPRRQCC